MQGCCSPHTYGTLALLFSVKSHVNISNEFPSPTCPTLKNSVKEKTRCNPLYKTLISITKPFNICISMSYPPIGSLSGELQPMAWTFLVACWILWWTAHLKEYYYYHKKSRRPIWPFESLVWLSLDERACVMKGRGRKDNIRIWCTSSLSSYSILVVWNHNRENVYTSSQISIPLKYWFSGSRVSFNLSGPVNFLLVSTVDCSW